MTSSCIGHNLIALEDHDCQCFVSRLERLLSIGNASGLYKHMQAWLYLDTADIYEQQSPFQCFYPEPGMCLRWHLWCAYGVLSHLSLLLQGHPTRPPQQLLTVRQGARQNVKCRGSDLDHSMSCLGSSGKKYLLSCWSLSHLMGDGILHFISFQWLYQAIDVFWWWPKMLLDKK